MNGHGPVVGDLGQKEKRCLAFVDLLQGGAIFRQAGRERRDPIGVVEKRLYPDVLWCSREQIDDALETVRKWHEPNSSGREFGTIDVVTRGASHARRS